ncbi:hypothetical protein CRV24_005964 [Beauveria bassiana]|nr:hypothetical protein CRV24_005964 [Beauveria bassiana]
MYVPCSWWTRGRNGWIPRPRLSRGDSKALNLTFYPATFALGRGQKKRAAASPRSVGAILAWLDATYIQTPFCRLSFRLSSARPQGPFFSLLFPSLQSLIGRRHATFDSSFPHCLDREKCNVWSNDLSFFFFSFVVTRRGGRVSDERPGQRRKRKY